MAQRPPSSGIPWSRLLLGIGAGVIVLVAFSSYLAVEALLAGNSPQATHASTPSGTPSRSMLPPATTTAHGAIPDWHTYSFPVYGFRLDISSALAPQHALLINNGAGEAITWAYPSGTALGSPLQAAAAETTVRLQYTTVIAETNLCPSGGSVVTVGSGLHASQQTDVPPSPNGPAASWPYVRVSLVAAGVAIRIELDGQGAPETFFGRYGAMWQHMLASFATFPPLQPLTTHPCP